MAKQKTQTSKTAWTITTIVVIAIFIIAIVMLSTNKKDTSTKEETQKTKVLVFDWKGEVQKSLKFRLWKQKEGYTENIYKGGQIELKINASVDINYLVTSGENCLFSVDEFDIKRGTIKQGSVIINNTTPGTSFPYNPLNLCLEVKNSEFTDWNNAQPASISIEVYELR